VTDPSSIETLLKLAGERDQPSAGGIARARAAAKLSWQRALATSGAVDAASTGSASTAPGFDAPAEPGSLVPVTSTRRRSRSSWTWTLAACVAIAATLALWPRPVALPVDVARVSAVDGRVDVGTAPVSLATVVRSGDVLVTADGRVALAVGDALSLRVDRHTRLRFDAPGEVSLLDGAVYVDSGGLNAHTALRIDTPAGAVRHVGTQFQVRVRGAGTRVLVREGRVVLTRDGAPLDLGAGDLAEVVRGTLKMEHGQAASGAAWEWAAATAPPFEIENRPLSEFLAWLAREHGWELRYADADTQSRARDIRLHGSFADLDAARMLDRASLITGVALRVREGSLLVGVVR
jgi:ferric-dicitrate binding protein FerR (iron transport regulator)